MKILEKYLEILENPPSTQSTPQHPESITQHPKSITQHPESLPQHPEILIQHPESLTQHPVCPGAWAFSNRHSRIVYTEWVLGLLRFAKVPGLMFLVVFFNVFQCLFNVSNVFQCFAKPEQTWNLNLEPGTWANPDSKV